MAWPGEKKGPWAWLAPGLCLSWIAALVTLTLLCAFFPEALLLLPPALSHLVDVPSSRRKQTNMGGILYSSVFIATQLPGLLDFA